MAISLQIVTLITGFVESFLVAAYLMLLLIYGYTRRGKESRSIWAMPLFISSVVLACLLIAHWAVVMNRILQAFFLFQGGKAPLRYLADLQQPTQAIKSAFTLFAVGISDCMMVYRLWVVWNGFIPIIVLPVLCIIGLTVSAIAMIYQFTIFPFGEEIFSSIVGRWILCDITFTLATNLYCTMFISYKIWTVSEASKKYVVGGNSKLRLVLAVFIEGAALFTSWSIILLALYLHHQTMQFLFADCIAHVAAIATMLINVRIGLDSPNGQQTSSRSKISTFQAQRSFGGPMQASRATDAVAVHITQAKHHDYPLDDMNSQYTARKGDLV